MVGDKTLYRSRDAVLGGVCAGIANYFAIDIAITRILMVVLTLLTGGVLGVLYLALWLILPKEPKRQPVVDVAPASVHSEVHGGAVDANVTARAGDPASTGSVGRGVGHVPPVRPPSVPSHSVSASVPSSAPACAKPVRAGSVRAMLAVGLALLFSVSAACFSGMLLEIRWWQLWPLVLIIVGIADMVLPTRVVGCRCWAFTRGLLCFFSGMLLLPFSTGMVAWGSLPLMVDKLWPLFCIMAGFFLIAVSIDKPEISLCGGLAFAVFCIGGLAWFALPGDVALLTANIAGKTFIVANPWM